ncbi:MAG: polysaccharide deacetylase family protein [Bacilli bacterium]
MKYKRKFKIRNIIIICSFLVISFLSLSLITYKFSNKNEDKGLVNATNPTNASAKRNKKIDKFVKDNTSSEKVVKTIDFNKTVTSILIDSKGVYESYAFDYATGDKVGLDKLIKPDMMNNFNNKIKELLYLKYPAFIADVLVKNDKKTVYYFKENELIIYYYEYEILPVVTEKLFLKVNYNEINKFLEFTVNLDKEYKNEDGSLYDPTKKVISITFDDGPSLHTAELVDVLNKNKAKATFFFVGKNLKNYSNAVLSVFNSGHEIGYHSYAHQSFLRQDINGILSDLNTSNEILKSITGTTFKLTRPPYGSINEAVKNAMDTPFILWDVDTNDWRYKDVPYLVKHVDEYGKDGDIVLFHDLYQTSLDAIKELLPILYAKGYQVVSVSKLAEIKGKTLDSHMVYRSLNY